MYFSGSTSYFFLVFGSERKDVANSSQQTELSSVSTLQNTTAMETSTDGVTVDHNEFTTESDADEGREEANIGGEAENVTDNESHSPAVMDTTEDSSSVEHESGLTDAEVGADPAENSQENPADISTESMREKVRYCGLVYSSVLNMNLK